MNSDPMQMRVSLTPPRRRMVRLPLIGGAGDVNIDLPMEPLSHENWSHMMRLWTAMRPALCEPSEQSGSVDP
jgi:hypothetical protein